MNLALFNRAGMTSGGSNRSKDGVPSWDGNATTFQAYEEQVLVWEQGVKYENRYLCGPRLAAELTGAAQRMIVGKSPTWVSFNGGVAVFLDHLRQGLGKPQIPEATEYLNKYFRSSRRRMGEGINEYITRKTETYWRACQALKRVMPRNASNQAEMERWRPPTTSSGGPWGSRRSSWTSDATGDENETDNAESDGTATTTAGSRTSWSQPYGGSWWSGSSWDWSSYYGSWSWKSTSWEPEATKDAVEILPEFVQAWYLLVDAGLTNAERNLIHTAVRGEYTIARVAHELRAQHGDGDGRRREQGGQAYWGEGRDEDATDHEQDEEDVKDFDTSIFDEEEAALWNENQEEIESAHAVLREAKRTLRSAREKQHQVKMSRKYFRPSGGSHDGPPRDDSKMTCLRCGKVGHRARNCPQKPKEGTTSWQGDGALCVLRGRPRGGDDCGTPKRTHHTRGGRQWLLRHRWGSNANPRLSACGGNGPEEEHDEAWNRSGSPCGRE